MHNELNSYRERATFSCMRRSRGGKRSRRSRGGKRSRRSRIGFTLIELLAAVAIVGVLATIALPRYRAFIARSRAAEAKVNLSTILSLQRSYFYEYDKNPPSITYGNCKSGGCNDAAKKNELGFRTADCGKTKYTYSSAAGFGANANSDGCEIYPGCGTDKPDQWDIYANGILNHDTNVIEACTE